MSNEVFEMLCAMDRRKVELQIVLQCAPTIAGLKTSNLLIVSRDQEDKVRFLLRHSKLMGYRLVYDRHRVIFLVFNKEMLVDYLSRNDVREFLKGYGYRTDAFGYSLRNFQERYDSYVHNRKDFPHEIGVFLGYPLCDVKGFIDNGGEDYKISGYWKVYENPDATKQLFDKFDDIKDEMVRKIYKKERVLA
ncbi:Protein of unknown function [Pseudobutyrivibrio sp. 49]|uniref:DUF3793 family protein n=1 Tax=unclassified Pseudobutyrivibrio TaxID=2638619 RepID=UPI00088DA2D8|nr:MULTISPECIES: DUF3793 family protein [unclassified Pseudobutyrivibrio]SDH79727.1 Protein of unknown function [Pseudobutyrivibrio sp. 49]SFO02038.1 Protein of unknown function [Pseudobutyrivibrio sp. UC1225]